MVRALADLLVDREGDPGGGARRVVADELRDGGHDRRHARLVVRAQQRRPVARDEVVPEPVGERGHLGGIEDLRRVARKADRLARPGAVDDRPDARPRRVGGRVDVRDQPDRRGVGHRAGQRREDVARLGQLDVLDTERVGARRPGVARGRAASPSTGRSASRPPTGCRSRRSGGTARAAPRRAPRRAAPRSGGQPSVASRRSSSTVVVSPSRSAAAGNPLVRRVELRRSVA